MPDVHPMRIGAKFISGVGSVPGRVSPVKLRAASLDQNNRFVPFLSHSNEAPVRLSLSAGLPKYSWLRPSTFRRSACLRRRCRGDSRSIEDRSVVFPRSVSSRTEEPAVNAVSVPTSTTRLRRLRVARPQNVRNRLSAFFFVIVPDATRGIENPHASTSERLPEPEADDPFGKAQVVRTVNCDEKKRAPMAPPSPGMPESCPAWLAIGGFQRFNPMRLGPMCV